jgi:hypothetical protein
VARGAAQVLPPWVSAAGPIAVGLPYGTYRVASGVAPQGIARASRRRGEWRAECRGV